MKCPIYSVRDNKSGFGTPIFEMNDQSAIRGFSYRINNPGIMQFCPSDFDLYKVGVFDSEKGIIISEKVPVLIVSGSSLVGV